MNTNEETLLDAQGAQKENNPMPETAPVENNKPAEKKQNSKNTLKGVAMGVAGAAGIGGAALLITSFKEPDEQINGIASQTQTSPEASQFNGEEIPHATGVNDDMSFSEAFAEAREEVGAGGVFQWHGGTYSTYYANEWEALSPDYQQAFSNYPYAFACEEEALPPVQPQAEYFGEHRIYTDNNGNQFILLEDLAGNEVRVSPESLQYVLIDEEGSFVGVSNDEVLFPDDEVAIFEDEPFGEDVVTIVDDEPIIIDLEDGIEPVEDSIELIDEIDVIVPDDVTNEDLDTIITDDSSCDDMMSDFQNDADISDFA